MAKRYARRRGNETKKRPSRSAAESAPAQELSLEEILEEYRSQMAAEEETAPPAAENLTLREDEGIYTAQVTQPEAEPESGGPAPEAGPLYEEEEELPPTPVEPETPRRARAPSPQELVEGYDDDADFYAGAAPLAGEEEEDSFASPEPPEEEPEGEKPVRRAKNNRTAAPRKGGGGLWGRFVGFLALASLRREQRASQPAPEPEDVQAEMEPRKAARHYASQMPSLRLRALVAGAVCLLLTWITLSCGFGWPLPGDLDMNLRAAALVCLAGELTVLLLGLDIVTSGFMSLLRGRPGAESLIVLAAFATVLDTAAVCLTNNAERGLPFAVIPSSAAAFALWGAWWDARAYHDSFLTLFHVPEPYSVTSEALPGMETRGLMTSRLPAKGFIRRSEEPSLAESIAAKGFFPMAGASLALALAVALGSGDPGAFFHLFSLLTALCAGFGWLFSFPLLFAKTARHLMMNGSAIAGWTGAREMGSTRQLVLTDNDIFPADTLEITGIRILDKSNTEKIIACTGSILAAAGTGSAAVFTELMRQRNAALQQVEDFTVGEGGAKGNIQGAEVRVGTAGYMHLSGVKIPDKLKEENALYTAVNGDLSGVFLFRYRPLASVQRSLYDLRRARSKPVFAVRDFNLDPMMVQKEFGVSTEGFRFPPFAERYRISSTPASGESIVAGFMGREGLDSLVDLSESGNSLYQMGRITAWACLVSVVLGAVLMLLPCWRGSWSAVSAGRVLVYMLVWLLPGVAGALLLRK